MKAFYMDVAKCRGCRSCQFACKDEHCGNDWMPYARPQPEIGQFWCRNIEYIRGTVPKVKTAFVTDICQHCDAAPCIRVCSAKAIYKRDDGLVIIDPQKCTGCRLCMSYDGCPYGAVYFNDNLKIAQKCTGCAHLIDRGWKEPRCTDACFASAINFGEEDELKELISRAETRLSELGTKPRVYYLNLPKRFIAGTVYDPVQKEIIEGATCTLSGDGTETLTTNDFGDFWFEGLKVGIYSVKIEAGGKSKTIDNISTEMDVNLGDIALS
jgi:Fe-S-cluster-containing dehydrogenase component